MAQARRLAERMAAESFSLVQASPRERARQTAEAIVGRVGTARLEAHEALDEVDFGSWAGQDFATLATDPLWRNWNERRSCSRPPEGEAMREVQDRITGHIARLAALVPIGAVVLVSHAEVIRAALLHFLGLSLDAWARLEISPASITRVALGAQGATVVGLNEVIG